MGTKAIALISGGLDSLLAARVVMDQGIEVKGACFVMPFASKNVGMFKVRVEEAARSAGIPLEFVDIADDFLRVLVDPAYGYGSNMNPCIDCKILMLSKARDMMEREKADFVITGEVVGERPMSQNKQALNSVKKRSGLEGYLVRPLSAKLLEETIPENEGKLDRSRLLDIQGRSRARQFELAARYGLSKFFSPAGGCLLTDKGFSKRLVDLMERGQMDLANIALLKCGRHFRLDERTKAVVGRDERDNDRILFEKKPADIILKLKFGPGPHVLLRGDATGDNIRKAASLCLCHSKNRHSASGEVEYWSVEREKKGVVVLSLSKEEIEKMRL